MNIYRDKRQTEDKTEFVPFTFQKKKKHQQHQQQWVNCIEKILIVYSQPVKFPMYYTVHNLHQTY